MPKAKTRVHMRIEMISLHIQHRDAPSDLSRHNSVDGKPQSALFHKQRILCVDDEIVSTRLRGDVLEEHGYSVTLYHCPLAVLRCDFSKFDLAILDFQMPGLNGRELLLRMRASGARSPIVLLSGCVDVLSCEDRVLFARCIDKACHIESLLDAIGEFLNPNQIPD
jgi:CheY-like chemotaxis protein